MSVHALLAGLSMDARPRVFSEEMGLVAADLGLKLSAKELADAFGEMVSRPVSLLSIR